MTKFTGRSLNARRGGRPNVARRSRATLGLSISSDQALSPFLRRYPEFLAGWESPDNYHRDRGLFTPHGVYAEFASFFVTNGLSLDTKRASIESGT
jgi:hypothetical protein